MYENVTIEDLDYYGRGTLHIDGKIVFVKDALPDEIVDIKITLNKKKYSEAEVLNYRKKSSKRINSLCPYFNKCGGCQLFYYNYQDTLNFKYNKVRNLLQKKGIKYDGKIDIIKNEFPLGYRNKLSLKIIDGKIGFYEDSTHFLVQINKCLIANADINEVIKNYKLFNIGNGELIVRTNSNKEVLIIINSRENIYNIELEKLKEIVKLVGIVYNNKCIYGNDFYYERLDNKLFKVSYDSFFQVNPYITKELFKLVSSNIDVGCTLLDLYSGVGTLSIVAASKAKEVYSVEIVKNAVLNGNINAKLNEFDNIKFFLGDTSKIINNLNIKFDTLIVDPPRKGLDKKTIDFIIKKKPKKIIYISCDLYTLLRDLKLLYMYKIEDYKILDMFSYTYQFDRRIFV